MEYNVLPVRPNVVIGPRSHEETDTAMRWKTLLHHCNMPEFSVEASRIDPPCTEASPYDTTPNFVSEAKTLIPDLIQYSVDQGMLPPQDPIPGECAIPVQSAVSYSLFVHTIVRAYSQHYPLELTPDDVRLVIAQGLAQHLSHSKEPSALVYHTGEKKRLLVDGEKHRIIPGNPYNDWPAVIADFTDLLRDASKPISIFDAKLSTTTPVQQTVVSVARMECLKDYFEYVVHLRCGIPWVRLRGTPEDWRSVRDAAADMSKYNLDWWLNQLLPVLDEMVRTSEHQCAGLHKDSDLADFWNRICCIHQGSGPTYVSGWINYLFPYDREGKSRQHAFTRNIRTEIGHFPSNLSVAPMFLKIGLPDGPLTDAIPMQVLAGFVGVYQNRTTHALRPYMGWSVCTKKDTFVAPPDPVPSHPGLASQDTGPSPASRWYCAIM